MIASSVPKFLVNKVVVQGIHKARFSVAVEPSRFEVFACGATFVGSDLARHVSILGSRIVPEEWRFGRLNI
jgi:hypothetical protein